MLSPKSNNPDKKSHPSKSNPTSPKTITQRAGTLKVESQFSNLVNPTSPSPNASPTKDSVASALASTITSKLSKAATLARDKQAKDRMMAQIKREANIKRARDEIAAQN